MERGRHGLVVPQRWPTFSLPTAAPSPGSYPVLKWELPLLPAHLCLSPGYSAESHLFTDTFFLMEFNGCTEGLSIFNKPHTYVTVVIILIC